MKISLFGACLFAALAASLARAADGDQFVIRGEAAKALLEQNSINVATAEKIAQICVADAIRNKARVSIAIYDQFGEMVYFTRMDGEGKISVDTAMMKARTVLNTRQPSKAAMNAVLSGRTSEPREILYGNFANAGGLPIILNGNQFIGAIGVGGAQPRGTGWTDEICAWNALNQVIGKQPPLLPDLRPVNPGG
jgi:glc operon protein GlcG